ncbi:MAG TPA: glycosyltransferase family 9 protein, partial [Gemmataceae bacterium]|nr:glycosyltransferase family 9 protein [Gemmataceae bacterium]
TDWAEETEPEMQTRHEVRRQLDLVAGISCCTDDETMRLRLPAEVRQRVAHTCDRLDLGAGQRWAVVHPGASAASRRYPLGLFAQVCRQLVDAHGLRLIFTGTRPEKSLSDEIRAGIGAGSDSLAGELTVVELAALLERAPLLIANNTGPVHLAAAVGCPVVDLYALTNPQHTPWLVPHRVLYHDVPCRWCYKSVCPQEHHDCLEKVPPEAVVAAAIELLATRG